jgi:hypothetical protein
MEKRPLNLKDPLNSSTDSFNSNVCLRLAKSGLTYFPFSLKTTSNINLAFGSLKTNNLLFNNIKFKSFIHSSSILNSDSGNPQPNINDTSSNPQPIFADTSSNNHPNSHILDAVERLENERLSNLKLIKYQETPAEDDEAP